MREMLNKAVSLGFGLAAASKEQIEKLAEEWVKKGELSRAESKEFVEELVKKGEEARDKADSMIRDRVQSMLGEGRYATKEELEQLERRLDVLELKLS
jgi:polyhydroxyalkanoate synthesis regulator phasin